MSDIQNLVLLIESVVLPSGVLEGDKVLLSLTKLLLFNKNNEIPKGLMSFYIGFDEHLCVMYLPTYIYVII